MLISSSASSPPPRRLEVPMMVASMTHSATQHLSSRGLRGGFSAIINSQVTLIATILFISTLPSYVFGALILTPGHPEKAFWTREQFMITCQNTEPLARNTHLEWLNPDMQRIEDEDASSRIHVERTDGQGLRLVNLNTTKRDSGQYRCVMVELGEAKETVVFNLRIFEAINFQGTRTQEIAQEGETFSMACHVKFDRDGLQQSSVSWLFNGVPLENSPHHEIRDYDGSKSLLTIRRVNRYSGGRYMCRAVALNRHISDIKEFVINLRVQFAPRIDREKTTAWILDPNLSPDDIRSRVRQMEDGTLVIPVNITCLGEADPPARFRWLNQMGYDMKLREEVMRHHRNRPMNPADVAEHIWYLTNESMSVMQVLFHYKPPTGSHGLIPPSAPVPAPTQIIQSPRYKCIASNEMATDEATFDIRVGEGPITPEIHSYEYRPIDNILTIRLFPLGRKIHPPIDLYRLDFSGFYVYFNETHLVNETDLMERGGFRHTVMMPGGPGQPGQPAMGGVHPGGHPGMMNEYDPQQQHTGYQGKKINQKQHKMGRPHVTDARLNTYVVEAEIPPGYHTVILIAHNPIGWSQPRTAAESLQVSGGYAATTTSVHAFISSLVLSLLLSFLL